MGRGNWSDLLSDADYIARWKADCIITPSGCWEWQKSCEYFRNQKPGQRGYAASSYRNKKVRLNRKMLELKLGRPLAVGMHACHTCDNPPCINPDHLYEATNQQNHIDGGKRGRMNGQAKTHCQHGHEFTPHNTYWSRRKTANGVIGRIRNCRTCQRVRQRLETGWSPEEATAPPVPAGVRTKRRDFRHRLSQNGSDEHP